MPYPEEKEKQTNKTRTVFPKESLDNGFFVPPITM